LLGQLVQLLPHRWQRHFLQQQLPPVLFHPAFVDRNVPALRPHARLHVKRLAPSNLHLPEPHRHVCPLRRRQRAHHRGRRLLEFRQHHQPGRARVQPVSLRRVRQLFPQDDVLLEARPGVGVTHVRPHPLEGVAVNHLIGRQHLAGRVLHLGHDHAPARGRVLIHQTEHMAPQAEAVGRFEINRPNRGQVVGEDDLVRPLAGNGSAGEHLDGFLGGFPLAVLPVMQPAGQFDVTRLDALPHFPVRSDLLEDALVFGMMRPAFRQPQFLHGGRGRRERQPTIGWSVCLNLCDSGTNHGKQCAEEGNGGDDHAGDGGMAGGRKVSSPDWSAGSGAG